jgi:myo-inositol-1-phosphate synthase
LATPLILDLTVLAELLTRVTYRRIPDDENFQPLYSVLSLLSYMLKAPLVKPGTEFVSLFLHLPFHTFSVDGLTDFLVTRVVNSLSRQRLALETFLKACLGLQHETDLLLNTRVW